jgi:two-component system, OmpR family, response regulator CpxR
MRPKKIILCVDDNEQELSVTKFLLFTNGYKVFAAINAQEALGIFAEQQIDLVLADHTMPQMTGGQQCSPLELLEKIKLMSARKRGPRKGSIRLAHAPVAELAAAS